MVVLIMIVVKPALQQSRGCLGCFSKPLVISMGEADASKGLKTQAQTMNNDNRSDDFFWSSSAIELDHGAIQSQRSMSSISVSNHPSDPQSSDGIQTDSPEFVNHGKFAVIFQFIYYHPSICICYFKFCFFYLDGITLNICGCFLFMLLKVKN